MDMWKSISGMVEGELVSADVQQALMRLNAQGIELYGLQFPDAVTVRFWIRRRDWERGKHLCEKGEDRLILRRKKGFYWKLAALKHRKLLVAGMGVLLFLTLFIPSRVFFVQVSGNERIPRRQILAAAESCGIRFGASRRAVRSEKVKNTLLTALPQLQWAGVNTAGCVATISVRERADQVKAPEEKMVGSIVADRDGFLLTATATHGNLLVHPGQTVQKGDVLISGYTDCGISIRAERAEGEILAQTGRQLEIKAPLFWNQKWKTGRVWKKISLVLGKKRIFLWKDSGIPVASCDRMYEKRDITLPGDFRLPVSLWVETFEEITEKPLPPDGIAYEEKLREYGDRYLTRQMQAGQILQRDIHIRISEDVCIFEGEYVCREMIGRLVQEQIGEANGENS